ncbi:MAG: transcriptional regulator [Halobacteriovorax sp.]|nr:transcriptional regulator [Halobacteriovorax sp.]|tara:strand:- start:107588 stop:107917 length:330 start_codon:yes stop_codon:yes gene_type:complete
MELDQKEIDRLFFALSDSTRRGMLSALTEGESSLTELGSSYGLTKQAISKHIKVLHDAGLITKRRDGRIQRCRLNPESLQKVEEVIGSYRKFWEHQFNALEDYIESLDE